MFLLHATALLRSPASVGVRNFIISSIDVKTGIPHLNTDLLFREPGQNHVLCYWNTRSYWPLAYHPGQNALYVPYDRVALAGHQNWVTEHPRVAWNGTQDLTWWVSRIWPSALPFRR